MTNNESMTDLKKRLKEVEEREKTLEKEAEKASELKKQLEKERKKASALQKELQKKNVVGLNKRVYSDKSIKEFDNATKRRFIKENLNTLKNLLDWVNVDKRETDKESYISINRDARNSFEDWTVFTTGNRWLINRMSLYEQKYNNMLGEERTNPKKDFVEIYFTHKGYLRYMTDPSGGHIADFGAPPVNDIIMFVRVYRREVEGM